MTDSTLDCTNVTGSFLKELKVCGCRLGGVRKVKDSNK